MSHTVLVRCDGRTGRDACPNVIIEHGISLEEAMGMAIIRGWTVQGLLRAYCPYHLNSGPRDPDSGRYPNM